MFVNEDNFYCLFSAETRVLSASKNYQIGVLLVALFIPLDVNRAAEAFLEFLLASLRVVF